MTRTSLSRRCSTVTRTVRDERAARREAGRLSREHAALRRVAALVAQAAPPEVLFAAVAAEVGQVFPAADCVMIGRYDSGRALEVVGGWSRAGGGRPAGRCEDLGGRNALTASCARIIAGADETRHRIERDLHDGAQQRLVSLALRLRVAQAAVPAGSRPGAGTCLLADLPAEARPEATMRAWLPGHVSGPCRASRADRLAGVRSLWHRRGVARISGAGRAICRLS